MRGERKPEAIAINKGQAGDISTVGVWGI